MLAPAQTPGEHPWVLGIRRPKAREWLARVEALLLHTFVNEPPGEETAVAESGLGFQPSCYWYICRTEGDFGHIVFLWTEEHDVSWGSSDAATPFDTGGVWHEKIVFDPLLSDSGRKQFVAAHSQPVSAWLGEFVTWLQANYDRTADYIRGVPPRAGVPGIVYDSQNEPRAWTWEARLEKSSYRRQVGIRKVFWTADDRRAFENWIEAGGSGLDVKVAEDLLLLVDEVTVETPRTVRANEEVVNYLLRVVP
jgi:hypothetical protein